MAGIWCDFKRSTAQNFMRVANEFSNCSVLSSLQPTKIFALLDVPSEDREEFISQPHEVNGQTKTIFIRVITQS